MDRFDKTTRQFVQLSKAWYAEANLRGNIFDEILVGFYCPEGSTVGEIAKTQDMPEGVTVEEWCWKSDRVIRDYLESLQQRCPKCHGSGFVPGSPDSVSSNIFKQCDCIAGEQRTNPKPE